MNVHPYDFISICTCFKIRLMNQSNEKQWMHKNYLNVRGILSLKEFPTHGSFFSDGLEVFR